MILLGSPGVFWADVFDGGLTEVYSLSDGGRIVVVGDVG